MTKIHTPPAHSTCAPPQKTLAGYAKEISAHDKLICRYKMQSYQSCNNAKNIFLSRATAIGVIGPRQNWETNQPPPGALHLCTPSKDFGRLCQRNFCPRQFNLSL